jgi:5,10-methylenetetrahydromethanopterin reductase
MLSGTVLEAGEDPRSDRVLEAVGPWRVLAWHGAYARDGAEVVDAMPGGRAWRTELEALAPEGEHHLLTFEGQATHLAPRDVPLLEHEDAGGMARGEIVGDPESVKGEIDRLSCAGFNEVVYTPERT